MIEHHSKCKNNIRDILLGKECKGECLRIYGPEKRRQEDIEKIKSLTEALEEVVSILEEHPTNKMRLVSGEEGYDSRARYAYLVAKDSLKS